MTAPRYLYLILLACAIALCGGPTPTVAADTGAANDSLRGHPLIYLAGPLGFSVPGRKYQDETLIPELERVGFQVFDPWRLVGKREVMRIASMSPGPKRATAWKTLDTRIGVRNATAIEECDAMLAVLDGPDVDGGTAAEIGFAAAKNKPIIGYRSDLRLAGDNEGATINLQVEHFIIASGGTIVKSLAEADSALLKSTSDHSPPRSLAAASAHEGDSRNAQEHDELSSSNADALDVIKFFSAVFTVVLALALGEAFKQFVADNVDHTMHWNRLPTLIIFLATIIPFFEGMNRLFDVNYNHNPLLAEVYPVSLIVDSAVFMFESILFFIMSRALSPKKVSRVLVLLFLLFVADFLRDIAEVIHVPHKVGPWTWESLPVIVVLGVAIVLYHAFKRKFDIADPKQDKTIKFNEGRAVWVLSIIAALAVVRTFLDYYLTWGFYFPTVSS